MFVEPLGHEIFVEVCEAVLDYSSLTVVADRVAELAVAVAKELGRPEEQIHGRHLASTTHDLGKIRIPGEILCRPGNLTDIALSLINTHPRAGYAILKDVESPWPIAQIVLQHHERQDGRGYPRGLKAEQVLLQARILAVADVVEAMSSHRPCRPALGLEKALSEIEPGHGIAYEPAVVDACVKLFNEEQLSWTRVSDDIDLARNPVRDRLEFRAVAADGAKLT